MFKTEGKSTFSLLKMPCNNGLVSAACFLQLDLKQLQMSRLRDSAPFGRLSHNPICLIVKGFRLCITATCSFSSFHSLTAGLISATLSSSLSSSAFVDNMQVLVDSFQQLPLDIVYLWNLHWTLLLLVLSDEFEIPSRV